MHDGIGHMTPPKSRHLPPPRSRHPPLMFYDRTVRILLECILVCIHIREMTPVPQIWYKPKTTISSVQFADNGSFWVSVGIRNFSTNTTDRQFAETLYIFFHVTVLCRPCRNYMFFKDSQCLCYEHDKIHNALFWLSAKREKSVEIEA